MGGEAPVSLFPLSPGGESRGPPPPPPLPRRRGGAGAGGAVVPPAPGEGQIGHRRLAAAATARLAGGPLSWRRREAWSSRLLPGRSPWAERPPFLFPLLPSGIVNRCGPARGPASRCGGSLPHPVCLRPGASPQAPRSFVCLLRESDCGALSVPLFCAGGLPWEGVVGESFERGKLGWRGTPVGRAECGIGPGGGGRCGRKAATFHRVQAPA